MLCSRKLRVREMATVLSTPRTTLRVAPQIFLPRASVRTAHPTSDTASRVAFIYAAARAIIDVSLVVAFLRSHPLTLRSAGTGLGSMFHAAFVHIGCIKGSRTRPNTERLRGLARLARAARRLRGSPSPPPSRPPSSQSEREARGRTAASPARGAVSPLREIGYNEAPRITTSQSPYWCCHKGEAGDLNASLWQANLSRHDADGTEVGCCPKFLRSKAPRMVAAGCGVPALITMCAAAVALSSQYSALTSIYWTRFETIANGTTYASVKMHASPATWIAALVTPQLVFLVAPGEGRGEPISGVSCINSPV